MGNRDIQGYVSAEHSVWRAVSKRARQGEVQAWQGRRACVLADSVGGYLTKSPTESLVMEPEVPVCCDSACLKCTSSASHAVIVRFSGWH